MPLPDLFKSPFNGEFDYSKGAILKYLLIKKIEDVPVAEALVQHPNNLLTEKINAGEGKYYGLAFFLYCLMKYGTKEEKWALCFTVTLPMAVEAQLYYGTKLWVDRTKPHPSITPFRLAAEGLSNITVSISPFHLVTQQADEEVVGATRP